MSPTVRDLHERATRDLIRDRGHRPSRDPLLGRGLWFGGLSRVGEHRLMLRKRRHAMAAEQMPPIGQAAGWYADTIQCVPPSGQHVARQIARLCGNDSLVTIPWRSLADAVGRRNRAGNLRSYTERGVRALVAAGWLQVDTVGRGRGARTTFLLLPGDPAPTWEREWLKSRTSSRTRRRTNGP
jgi:hypothetical protein